MYRDRNTFGFTTSIYGRSYSCACMCTRVCGCVGGNCFLAVGHRSLRMNHLRRRRRHGREQLFAPPGVISVTVEHPSPDNPVCVFHPPSPTHPPLQQ